MNQTPDHYAPPAAPLEDGATRAADAVRPRFPFGLVLRWLLALIYIGGALYSLVMLAMQWSVLADRSVIDSMYNPIWFLIPHSLGLVAGVLLALRRKWAALAVAAQLLVQVGFTLGFLSWRFITPMLLGGWLLEALVLWFCLVQWTKGRLR